MSFKSTISQEWRGKEVKVAARKATGKTAWELGLIVEGQAKLLCPVDKGRLSASITTAALDVGGWGSGYRQTTPKGKGAVATDLIAPPDSENEVFVGTPVFYGPYQEFGTVRNEAQPFLRPALALAKGQQLTILMYNGRLHFKEFMRPAA